MSYHVSESDRDTAYSTTRAFSRNSRLQISPTSSVFGGQKRALKNSPTSCIIAYGYSPGTIQSTSQLATTPATWQVLMCTAHRRATSYASVSDSHLTDPASHRRRTDSSPVFRSLARQWRKSVLSVCDHTTRVDVMLWAVLTVRLEQRKRLLHEIEGFLEATKQEQEYSVANEIPTPGEYWNYRMGTAGVSPTVACLE
jgi:hypothetical protein